MPAGVLWGTVPARVLWEHSSARSAFWMYPLLMAATLEVYVACIAVVAASLAVSAILNGTLLMKF